MTNPQHEHCDEHQQDTWFYNDELPTMIQVDISSIPIYISSTRAFSESHILTSGINLLQNLCGS